MKHKRLIAILLSLAMLLTFMPAMAFAGDEPGSKNDQVESQLPAPENLHWRDGGGMPYMAIWNKIEDKDLDYYHVRLSYSANGNSEEAYTEVNTNYQDNAYKFEDFFETHKDGVYWYSVKAIAKEGSEKATSPETISPKTAFRKLTVNLITVDTDGSTQIEEDGGEGHLSYENGSHKFTNSEYWPSYTKLGLKCEPESGFVVKSISFDNNPSDLVYAEETASFSLGDQNRVATITFQKDNTIVPVIIDFCEGHEQLANRVSGIINNDGEYKSSVDGTKLKLNWLLADKVSSPMSYVEDVLYEIINRQSDAGEYYYGTIGSKRLSEYSGHDEYSKDNENFGKKKITNNTKMFIHWIKPAKLGNFSVEKPICGTNVTVSEGAGNPDTSFDPNQREMAVQSPFPIVSPDKNSQIGLMNVSASVTPHWFTSKALSISDFVYNPEKWFEGEIQGKACICGFLVEPQIGYYIDWESKPEVTVNGKAVEIKSMNDSSVTDPSAERYAMIVIDVEVDHDWESFNGGQRCKKCGYIKYVDTTPSVDAVKKVVDMINALPAPEDVKASDESAIKAARDAYDKLKSYQKKDSRLTEPLKKLENCETSLENAKAADEYDSAVKAAKAKKVTLKSVKAKKGRKAVVRWTRAKEVYGYQIYYKAKGVKAKKVTVAKTSTVKKTLKKLKAGKKYSVKVRPYTKVVNPDTGKVVNAYGKWSKVKKAKAKK